MLIFVFSFGLVLFLSGWYIFKKQSKIYTIKVRGECIDSFVGKHINIQKFRYVIDEKEYEGTGRCANTKRKGKKYNLRVNKDDFEDFVSFPFMLEVMVSGMFFIIASIIGFVFDL
ncbi:MAG: hypothetical protein K6F17_00570 [Lachnospiraceae bacterium]|nr:hypothetical protein [Lachnospiraceae bacterium]